MSTGFQINIIGPQHLPNTLLASFLKEQTHAECHAYGNPGELPQVNDDQENIALTLIDCNTDKNTYNPLDTYEQVKNQLGDKSLYAFFNCQPGNDIENLASSLDIQGLFYEDANQENLYKGVQAIFDGDLWLPRRIITEQLQKIKNNGQSSTKLSNIDGILTNREIEILNLIATGAKNTDIAQDLCLSVHTIKTHIYHIYKKIDVSNRMQAVNWASQNLS